MEAALRRGRTLLLFAALSACDEQVHTYVADPTAAVAAGEMQPGWFPEWFPRAATEARTQVDLDTSQWWLRARLSPVAADSLKASLVPVEAREVVVRRPRRGGGWWFESLIEQHPENDGGLHADLFRGRGGRVPPDVAVAFDRRSDVVYAWSRAVRTPGGGTP